MGEVTAAEVALRAAYRITDLKRRVEKLEIENRALREFRDEVIDDYFQYDGDSQQQCQFCLWVAGRAWEPEHHCGLHDAWLNRRDKQRRPESSAGGTAQP